MRLNSYIFLPLSLHYLEQRKKQETTTNGRTRVSQFTKHAIQIETIVQSHLTIIRRKAVWQIQHGLKAKGITHLAIYFVSKL